METYLTDAINIKSYPLSDNDNIIVMFSKKMGLIRGIAKGVKRPKSKLGARMQTLVANRLTMDKRRNLDIIKEASALNPFSKLRYNLDKLTAALYVVETVNTFCIEARDEKQNETIYDILYKTLENIQSSENNIKITLNIIKFQLHFMKEIGFGLEFCRCLKCLKEIKDETSIFSLKTGGVICIECYGAIDTGVKLHDKLREFLLTLSDVEIDKETKYDELVNEKVVKSCFNILKKYIELISCKKSKTSKVMEETKVSEGFKI